MADVEVELTKLRYHIKLLADIVDHREYPTEWLIESQNWSEEEFDQLENLFEKYENRLESGGTLQMGDTSFERELKETFGLTFHSIKTIVKAFWRDDKWIDVCRAYAKEQNTSDFKFILEGIKDEP